MKRCHIIVIAAVVVSPSCAQTESLDYRRLAGCYALSVGRWSVPLGRDSAYHLIPRTIRMDTAPTGRGGLALSPDIVYPAASRRFPGTPYWGIVADTVRLVWSNGFSSTHVRLRLRDGDLEGEVVTQSDAHPRHEPPRPRATVRARRIPCPAGAWLLGVAFVSS